jgi:hypothetical protein
MDKEQLKVVVDRVHASWNIQPLPTQLQTMYRAWFDVLEEFDFEVVNNVISDLVKEDGWAPRPGTVYKRVKDVLSDAPPLSVHLAWEEYRRLAAQLDTGVWEEQPMHRTLQKCISVIGGYHLHTNSDREHFTQIYTQLVNEEYR